MTRGQDGLLLLSCIGLSPTITCQFVLAHHDGTPFWAHLEATAAQVADDATLVAHVILTDITERRHAARLLAEAQVVAESEEKFRKITESTQDAIIMMGADKCISLWNAAAISIFGYTVEEALGREMHPLLAPPEAGAAFERGFTHFLKSGTGPVIGKTLELTALHKGGMAFPVEITISALQINGAWNAIGIFRDITGRKQAEAKIAEQLDELRRWYDVMQGRELRIMELKREVNELLGQAGQPPHYSSVVSDETTEAK